MDELSSSEESAFIVEQIEPMLMVVIENVLKDCSYDEEMVPIWVDQICDGCMQNLTELNRPFKYAVSCVIMQANGAGVHTAMSCHWDSANDNCARIVWPDPKNKRDQQSSRMYCMVYAFGIGF